MLLREGYNLPCGPSMCSWASYVFFCSSSSSPFLKLFIFNLCRALSSPYYLLYYLYSFIFLVLRSLMLLLFASNVHCVGLEPIYFVYYIPSSDYDVEVRIFIFVVLVRLFGFYTSIIYLIDSRQKYMYVFNIQFSLVSFISYVICLKP